MSSTINALTSGGGLAMAGDTSGQLQLQTNNGTTAITIDTSQNVGIGTASPAYKLNVVGGSLGISNLSAVPTYYNNAAQTGDSGSSSATRTLMQLQTSGTQSTAGVLTVQGVIHPSVYKTIIDSSTGSGSAAPLVFTNANVSVETMRIDNSGNVFVGATSQISSEKFGVTQSGNAIAISAKSNGGPATGNYESSDATHAAYWTFGRDNQTTGNYVFAVNGTLRGSISYSTGAYTASSDSRLKKDITNLNYGLNEVLALRPVAYLMNEEKDTAKKHLGFIAQEVKAVMDEAVDDLIDPDTQFYGLDKSGLVPVLVKAIQELNAKVETQAAEIQTLKGVAP